MFIIWKFDVFPSFNTAVTVAPLFIQKQKKKENDRGQKNL